MKYERIRIIIFIFLLISILPLHAGEFVGGYGGNFLEWGSGARPIALGQAYTAIADQGNSIFWNPGGLTQNSGKSIAFMHSVLFADRTFNTIEASVPISSFTMGIGWQGFQVTDLEARDANGQKQGNFNDSENLFTIGIATNVLSTDMLTLRTGANGKYFYHSLYNNSATALGIDLGLHLQLRLPGIIKYVNFGTAVQNIGSTFSWDTESEYKADIPTTLSAGWAIRTFLLPLTASFDIKKIGERDIIPYMGLEYDWSVMAFRAGLNDDKVTGGLGIDVPVNKINVSLDYAVTTDNIAEQLLHFVTVNLVF